MFCLKCGEAIPDGSSVCPHCGANLVEEEKEQAIVYASQKESEVIGKQPKVHKKSSQGHTCGNCCDSVRYCYRFYRKRY